MISSVFLQKLRIITFPYSTYYAYRNPNYLKECRQGRFDWDVVFNEIRTGLYTEKQDHLKLLANKYWEMQTNMQPNEILYKLNLNTARRFLYIKDGRIYATGQKPMATFERGIEVGENYNSKLEWYYLKHLINKDILLATYFLDNNITNELNLISWNGPILTTDSLLDRMLDQGIAELHMHLGAAREFSYVWMWLMNPNYRRDKNLKIIKIPSYEGIIPFVNYIKAASIIRLLMGLFLMESDSKLGFLEYLQTFFPNKSTENEQLIQLSTQFLQGEKLHQIEDLTLDLILLMQKIRNERELLYKNSTSSIVWQLILSQEILSYVFTDIYKYNDSEKQFNPLSFNNVTQFIIPEHLFIFRCMNYISTQDKWFTDLFWQYVKIKNIVYRFIVQQFTSGKGLDTFQSIYRRQSKFQSRYYFGEVFYANLNKQNIKKFEIRTSLSDDESKVRSWLKLFFQEYLRLLDYHQEIPLIGIVYHFHKQDDQRVKGICYYSYLNSQDHSYINYGSLQELYKHKAKIIVKLRQEIPYLNNYVVGIDAASNENYTEPYVFKEAFAICRNSEHNDLSNLYDSSISSVGYTYHVGEDFRDIITGLRHVDEVIEELKFTAGDRLGHSIVIGIDIDKWALNNNSVYVPIGEYLENLLWEWGVYISDSQYRNIENIKYIESMIINVVEHIFGFVEGITVRDLYKVYKAKFSSKQTCFKNSTQNYEEVCKLQEYTKKKHVVMKNQRDHSLEFDEDIRWNPEMIMYALNCRYFVENIKQTVIINLDTQLIEKYKKLQKYVQKKISEKGIIVETNPTSNLFIGDFVTFEDYHIQNLSSPDNEEIIVTINTDDPIIFNTNLSNEFALIFDIMAKSGKYSRKEIIEWLDKIRQNGLNYSFIKDRGLSKRELCKEIKTILEYL